MEVCREQVNAAIKNSETELIFQQFFENSSTICCFFIWTLFKNRIVFIFLSGDNKAIDFPI